MVDEQGTPVQLRGCNAGAWLAIEPWIPGWELPLELHYEKAMWDFIGQRFGEEKKLELIRQYRAAFFTQADVRRIAAHGMNCLRVPVWWRAVSDPAYGGRMEYLDDIVRWCREAGIYAIIDLHGEPGGQNNWPCSGETNPGKTWKDEPFKQQTVDWWANVAARYRDEPAVAGYDIINEQVSAPNDDLIAFYDRIYKAIRAADPRHIIIIQDSLHGLPRLPHPSRIGWTNVMYSVHYYPQEPADGFSAASRVFHKYNRAAVYFGVPLLIGEFNVQDEARGGAPVFRRYMEIFDYYGWPWTFWTYKHLETDPSQFWGLYGMADTLPVADLDTDPPEKIAAAFERMRTEATRVNPPLQAILEQPPRVFPALVAPAPGSLVLTLKQAYVLRPGTNDTIRLEWGEELPNVSYWAAGDRVAWPVAVAAGGSYKLGLVLANVSPGNDVGVWLDGVHVMTRALGEPSGAWTTYVERAVGALELGVGKHVLELSHGPCADPYINLRGAVLVPAAEAGAEPAEDMIILHGPNMDIPPAGSTMCVQWMDDPSAIGYWHSGEMATWQIRLHKGGEYDGWLTYATPNTNTVLTVLADGAQVAQATLPSTGNWWEFRTVGVGPLPLAPGAHTLALVWEGVNPEGCGNLKDLRFVARPGP